MADMQVSKGRLSLRLFGWVLAASLLAVQGLAQSAPDPKALLAQALAAGGGTTTIQTVNDFIAHGTITYYYSPTQSKTGQVTIRGHGDGKFRMDSILQDGTTTAWAVNDGNGQVKDADGQIRNVGFPSAVNAGWLTLPYMRLATVLNDNLTQLSYIALLSINGASFHQIRASSPFGKVEDPGGLLADLRTADYYLSSVDLKVIAIADKLYPAASYWSEQPWSGNHQRRSANDLLLRFSAGEWDPDSICSYKRSRTTAVMDYPVDRHQFQYRRN